MDVPSDFSELLECFNAHGVEYVVVGAYALAHHGAPRATGDIDLYARPAPENAQRILHALDVFGFASLNLTLEDFSAPDKVVQLGVPPVRVDIVTGLDGVSWEQVWDTRESGSIGGVPVQIIGRETFVANKRAAGRLKDLADIEALGEAP